MKSEHRMVTRMRDVRVKGLGDTGHTQEKGHWKYHAFEAKDGQLLPSLASRARAWIRDLGPATGELVSQEEDAQSPPQQWHAFIPHRAQHWGYSEQCSQNPCPHGASSLAGETGTGGRKTHNPQ